ncbi:amino acid ABC transporter permease [Marinisporobacter balticus]|uniref:Amino acid ABC transporter membrane protein (PAAT family) n=1 Tax=Marinisporobacter balticus TaxID=2018667 RepID=A0A4R2KKR1_9FIRM|nr:amino acid ABC transporter permease [Marinisporobacter balticus]TCO74601.1 amino acid ABC transporter membrane protein (PAAT family) [Marinisporobacter balticus]
MSYITNITGFILQGSIITLKLYAVTIIFSIPLGVVCALGKISKSKGIKVLLELYTWIFRGTPLLLQLFFTYYGLPIFGIKLTQFQAASLTFIFNYGAYFTEIFRGGIESIDKGQYEAAKALGLNYRQTMMKIILPQALKRVLPPTSNEAITLIKDTALVAAIGMGDILRAAKEVLTRDFKITSFVVAGVIYLLLTSVVVIFFKKLEKKYSVYE